MTSPRRISVCVLAVSCLVAGSATTAAESRADPHVKVWMERMAVIHALMANEEWAKAVQRCDALMQDFARHLVIRGSDLIGTALIQRAVSLEAEGKHREALWDAFAADALSARARSLLAGYGIHGAALLDVVAEAPDEPELTVVAESGFGRLALPSSADKTGDAKVDAPEVIDIAGDVLPPEKVSGDDPQLPDSLRRSNIAEFIIVQVIVDEEGRPGRPGVLKGGGLPVLLLSALEAMKDWRFKPALLHGEPVQVYYTLTVNFRS